MMKAWEMSPYFSLPQSCPKLLLYFHGGKRLPWYLLQLFAPPQPSFSVCFHFLGSEFLNTRVQMARSHSPWELLKNVHVQAK